ncbi:MAG: hypothetical protein IJS00_00445 [Paludibacteraceae bacterium]|nr:hypothetical protein [Paludibacteraceae bacterium]
MLTTTTLIYILTALFTIWLAKVLWRALHTRVWITIQRKSDAGEMAYMDFTARNQWTEAYLAGAGSDKAIGRVGMTEQDDNAHVELLTSDFEEETDKPIYISYGYITPEGWVYKQFSPSSQPERIGYIARPSQPEQPTLQPERVGLFKLHAVLCAYLGNPDDTKHVPIALAYYKGLKNFTNTTYTPQARACAFAAFYQQFSKNKYCENYKTQPYSWSDTALLSSMVYCVLYLILSLADLITFKLADQHLIQTNTLTYELLVAFYLMVWALVRQVKIDSIEKSQSIQPVLDLLNKSLGHKTTDRIIIFVSLAAIYLLPILYDFNYNPMAIAILIGIIVNMTIKRNAQPWEIATSLYEDNKEDTDDNINPPGDIIRTYDWDLGFQRADNTTHGNLSLYFSLKDIKELRRNNPFYSQRDGKDIKHSILEMFNYLNEHTALNARLRYIVHYINRQAIENNLLQEDKLQFTLDFVQEPNITFIPNRNSQSILKNESYIRFPDETLYDKEADCNSKALLAAMLFHLMGHNVVFMYSRTQQHAAIAVEVTKNVLDSLNRQKLQNITVTIDNKQYIFCETTGDNFLIGGMAHGMKIEAFEDKVLLPA